MVGANAGHYFKICVECCEEFDFYANSKCPYCKAPTCTQLYLTDPHICDQCDEHFDSFIDGRYICRDSGEVVCEKCHNLLVQHSMGGREDDN